MACLTFGVSMSHALIVHAQYTAFTAPGFGEVELGYQFDGGLHFDGAWHPSPSTANDISLMIYDPSSIVMHNGALQEPWRTGLSNMDYDFLDGLLWTTNISGHVSGLSSGQIVTVFFLYQSHAESMILLLNDAPITTVYPVQETNSWPRFAQYGWDTDGIPEEAMLLGGAVQLDSAVLHFELRTEPSGSAHLMLHGVVLDLDNVSAIDNDNDGVADWKEISAGTDPYDPESTFSAMSYSATPTQTGVVLCWPSLADRSYRVRAHSCLLNPSFGHIRLEVPATPPMNCVTVSLHHASTTFFTISLFDEDTHWAIPFETVLHSTFAGFPDTGYYVVSDEQTWTDMVAELQPIVIEGEPSLAVDFDEHMLVGIVDPLFNHAGYDVEITGVQESAGTVTVSYERTMPEGTLSSPGFVKPGHIIRVDRSDKAVLFKDISPPLILAPLP